MLKEIFDNVPITKTFTVQEIREILNRDFVDLINTNTSVDLTKNSSALTSIEMEQIISAVKIAYQKIFESDLIAQNAKNIISNSLFCRLLELLINSTTPELFFIKIQQAFTPAQIAFAVLFFANTPRKSKLVLNFFYEHRHIFPKKQNKIHTIALEYFQMQAGGISRFISKIIPIYMQLGYRVILFTEEYNPDLEYSLPAPSELYKRVVLKSRGKIFEQLTEFEKYVKDYEIDLFISHKHWDELIPELHILFFKLCGVKIAFQIHGCITKHAFIFPNAPIVFKNVDFLATLSRTCQKYWENFGVRSYYIPNPFSLDQKEIFNGRNPKKKTNTIIFVGVIVEWKNPYAVLPIIKEVRKEIPDVKLKILGEIYDTKIFRQMKNFIVENRLEDNVEFLGNQKNMGQFYENADVMLSTSTAEGWGLAIAESKFYELPLVLYELPDTELLRDGKGYIAVPQGDFKAAARTIIKILTNTEFRCKLSAEARESIQPFIDYDIAGAWQKIFDDLDNDVAVPPHSVENEKIQTFLVEEIWQEKIKIQALAAQIEQLKK